MLIKVENAAVLRIGKKHTHTKKTLCSQDVKRSKEGQLGPDSTCAECCGHSHYSDPVSLYTLLVFHKLFDSLLFLQFFCPFNYLTFTMFCSFRNMVDMTFGTDILNNL